jgi:hypothetical protein
MWSRLSRDVVLTVPGPPTRFDWLDVGLELAGRGGAISGWDAVRLVGLGEPEPPSGEVLVLARSGRHRLVGNVRIRPTERDFETWTLAGDDPHLPYAPIARPARAIADTALLYRRAAPVCALVTAAVQRRLCRVEDLVAELEHVPRNDSAHFRRAVADAVGGARSVAEAEAIRLLAAAPVPEFEANVEIIDQYGTVIAVADLLWRGLRAVGEIDSRAYHLDEQGWARTLARHNLLTRCGLAVEHYPPSVVRGGREAWALEVASWLAARAAELGVPFVPARGPRRQRGTPPPLYVVRPA